jgi:hypothetical protein
MADRRPVRTVTTPMHPMRARPTATMDLAGLWVEFSSAPGRGIADTGAGAGGATAAVAGATAAEAGAIAVAAGAMAAGAIRAQPTVDEVLLVADFMVAREGVSTVADTVDFPSS